MFQQNKFQNYFTFLLQKKAVFLGRKNTAFQLLTRIFSEKAIMREIGKLFPVKRRDSNLIFTSNGFIISPSILLAEFSLKT